jgi:N-ethylmaleimide reductase
MSALLKPMNLHGLELANRTAMAPLTRCRAGEGDVPQAISAVYYAQRASAGLIVTEATNISPTSCAFEKAPGIYSTAQVTAWRHITDAVHTAGGRIFMQLWHCGRVGSDAILEGKEPLSPSAVNDDTDLLQVYGLMANGRYARIAATPSRAMTVAEVQEIVADYGKAAHNAIKAGCDGVEIHAANGYLPHQFLSPTTNTRTDQYGGSVQGRLQFLREVIDSVIKHVDVKRVGVRISPFAAYNNTRDPNPEETYTAVAKMLEGYGIAYLHLADTNAWAGAPDMQRILKIVKPHYKGVLMGNGGMNPPDGEKLVADGSLDMVAFGRPFLANPDLPARVKQGGPYNEPRYVGWYGGSAEGYTDYPMLQSA